MQKSLKYRIAVFFTILFMALISAPAIILSFDDSADISGFYGVNEEEENENLKLVFENNFDDSESFFVIKTDGHLIRYTFKTYPKPHLNLIFPPPEFS